jgi:hypothetical protein
LLSNPKSITDKKDFVFYFCGDGDWIDLVQQPLSDDDDDDNDDKTIIKTMMKMVKDENT